MTPLEIVEYKSNWNPGHAVQVDMDSDFWGKTYCRAHLEHHNWSFRKHTMPDDSHTFYFEDKSFSDQFLAEYNKHNPRFHLGKSIADI